MDAANWIVLIFLVFMIGLAGSVIAAAFRPRQKSPVVAEVETIEALRPEPRNERSDAAKKPPTVEEILRPFVDNPLPDEFSEAAKRREAARAREQELEKERERARVDREAARFEQERKRLEKEREREKEIARLKAAGFLPRDSVPDAIDLYNAQAAEHNAEIQRQRIANRPPDFGQGGGTLYGARDND